MRSVFSKFIRVGLHFQVSSVSTVTGETLGFVDALNEELLYKNIIELVKMKLIPFTRHKIITMKESYFVSTDVQDQLSSFQFCAVVL